MTIRRCSGFLLLVLAVGLAGCNRSSLSSAPSPSAPSPVQQPIPPPVPQPTATGMQLAGSVSDAAWRPLAGATVEVVDGPQTGLSTTTDARGQYLLTGAFNDTNHFRATKDGYVSATWPFPPSCAACHPNWWIHFYLEALAAHANIAGDYTLTFIADGACAGLPVEARTRTYAATVKLVSGSGGPSNSWFNVTVGGSTFLEHYNTFTIGVAGDYLSAEIGNGHGAPGLVEQVAPNTYLTLGGDMATSVTDASTISAPFYGAVDRCELPTGWGSRYSCSTGAAVAWTQCGPANHQLILTRR